jgi:transposase
MKLEAGAQQFLFKPEEIVKLGESKKQYKDSDYLVNVKNLVEEQRLISGIHDVYGKLFSNLGYQKVMARPSRNKMAVRIFTTIYFESFSEDELKRNGFSKDHQHNQPQILLALMVTSDGLPVDYEIFSGDTYEGHTLISALTKIRKKYHLAKIVFVADSAMLSQENLAE